MYEHLSKDRQTKEKIENYTLQRILTKDANCTCNLRPIRRQFKVLRHLIDHVIVVNCRRAACSAIDCQSRESGSQTFIINSHNRLFVFTLILVGIISICFLKQLFRLETKWKRRIHWKIRMIFESSNSRNIRIIVQICYSIVRAFANNILLLLAEQYRVPLLIRELYYNNPSFLSQALQISLIKAFDEPANNSWPSFETSAKTRS